ncbi:bifunctional DNA-formamidopyrimidine glycosylase/DNA-(apurinic or apyrimidinic site) lyase [Desulfoplanes formicivorans]|uniref:Formamidopyrimidine-DNA glycosylase n=1 Tax=Desulfoplanes formicivorans TaxID=1592317 RepID=A0A194AGN8_9BACT|nr:bifunctional DNA-formamidopyrimidine glycosylase/DNA-(apurinic or apyrimidinic site) lyase [Desulfoplanes formicivorans]GAU08375.1 DNA-formamidopyrimidine glycosylase [Desulfoplanes formicivorans]
MPELPEVETIARGLGTLLRGRTIVGVEIRYPEIVLGGDGSSWEQRLATRTIQEVGRRGKLLVCTLSGGLFLVFHLKMTGRVWVVPLSYRVCMHDHLVIHLQGGERVVFNDQRKFGYAGLFTADELAAWPFYRDLGPEPLTLTPPVFRKILASTRARIKAVLLDQKRIAGIGNIYADESLFRAGIHPCSQACALSVSRADALLDGLKEVLAEAIKAGGSSIRDYRNAHGDRGLFQVNLSVYGRGGLACNRCHAPLEVIRVAGRTSTFCPHCQACFKITSRHD